MILSVDWIRKEDNIMESDILKKEHIFLDFVTTSKIDCLKKLAGQAYQLGISNNAEQTFQNYIERESESSTGFTDGFAIPHARSKSIEKVGILVAKLKEPLDWDSMDGKPTNFIIALNVPEANEGNMHINLLSSLSRKIMKRDFRDAAKKSSNVDELYTLIVQALH